MKNILDFSLNELENYFINELKEPKFRAKQVFEWIYKKGVNDFSAMTNLNNALKNNLQNTFYIDSVEPVKCQQSNDGSKKYLFKLKDGKCIESVLLPMKDEIIDENGKLMRHKRYTICVSSQVGCKMGCAFCYTAKGGFVRNLSAGEIVGQILKIKRENAIAYERRVNIVYMGMGEPLDNLENLTKAIEILKHNDALAISPRRQTISTSGLASQIKKLGELDLGVLLAISLHAVNDELRQSLMPINKAYNIAAIIQAVREFPIDMRKRVMFEYLLLGGVNDRICDAKALSGLLNGIKAKVNLILFNPHEGSEFRRPSLKNAQDFRDFLQAKGLTCTIRQSKGLDISAACGQLKAQNEKF